MLLKSLLSILALVGAFLGFTSGNVLLMYKRRFTNHDDHDDDDDGGDDDDDPWEGSYEFFQIPALICNQTFGGVECGQYNAVANPEECSCNCPRENASFFYDGNDWTCQPDSRVRDFQGKNMFNKLQVILLTQDVFKLKPWSYTTRSQCIKTQKLVGKFQLDVYPEFKLQLLTLELGSIELLTLTCCTRRPFSLCLCMVASKLDIPPKNHH